MERENGMNLKPNILRDLFAIALSALVGAEAAHADPTGLWLAQDGGKVHVGQCGRALCGTLVGTEPPIDPTTGKPWTDKNNPDQTRRSRPIIGVVVLISMMPDGPGRWAGQLYNADSGETVSGHLIEIDNQTIRIEGCSGGLCGGETMSRMK
jgi:uncharacterized protein (DUF2147 family)